MSDNKDDLGQAEVQAKFDEAAEKGYFGEVPDSTPNEAYTLRGQSKTTEQLRRDRRVATAAKATQKPNDAA